MESEQWECVYCGSLMPVETNNNEVMIKEDGTIAHKNRCSMCNSIKLIDTGKRVLIGCLLLLSTLVQGQTCRPIYAESPNSNGEHLPALAVDSSQDSYWQDKYEMIEGQAFLFDMGAPCPIIAVLFDVGRDHCSGFPAEFMISTSSDGNTWIQTGDTFRGGTVSVADINTVVARFVKITVVRASAGRWSIADIRVE